MKGTDDFISLGVYVKKSNRANFKPLLTPRKYKVLTYERTEYQGDTESLGFVKQDAMTGGWAGAREALAAPWSGRNPTGNGGTADSAGGFLLSGSTFAKPRGLFLKLRVGQTWGLVRTEAQGV